MENKFDSVFIKNALPHPAKRQRSLSLSLWQGAPALRIGGELAKIPNYTNPHKHARKAAAHRARQDATKLAKEEV